MTDVIAMLSGGDRRSVGRVQEVVEAVLRDNSLLPALLDGMEHGEPVIQMRSADAAEKISRIRPGWFQKRVRELLEMAKRARQQEVRWHLAQILPRLDLDARQRAALAGTLRHYMKDESRIVRVCAMSALADLALADAAFKPAATAIVEDRVRNGSPAERARARKLSAMLAGRSG